MCTNRCTMHQPIHHAPTDAPSYAPSTNTLHQQMKQHIHSAPTYAPCTNEWMHCASDNKWRVQAQNELCAKQKNWFSLVFASNVLALCYVKIFFRKTSYKAVFGRFVISVLLQSGISDSDLFPQYGLCSPRTATALVDAPRLHHGVLLSPTWCQFARRHSRIDWTVSEFVSHKCLEH